MILNNVVTHLLRGDSANLYACNVSVQYFKNQPKLSILTSMLMVWLFQELEFFVFFRGFFLIFFNG